MKHELLSIDKSKNNWRILSPVESNKFEYKNTNQINFPYYTDSDNNEDEGLTDYEVNGYHLVHIGKLLLGRYIIM